MTKEKRQSIFPLLWVMLFDHTSLNITFPVLTLIFFDAQSHLFSADTTLATRSLWYGLCVSIPHFFNLFMTPILSFLSDTLGRKKILLFATFGAFLFAVTAGFGVLVGSLFLLLLGRIIQGAFSRTNPIAQAVIGDISTLENKVRDMGFLQLSISIGAFIGPLIGGYFANKFLFSTLNFSLPYWIAACFAGISCLLTFFIFDETHSMPAENSKMKFQFAAIKKIIFDRNILIISSILLFSQVSWSLYYQFMPPILKTVLKFDAHLLGLFVGCIALWLSLATSFGIKALQRFFNLKQMLLLSLYLVLIGLILSFVCIEQTHLNSICIWLAAIPTAVGDVIAYSCLVTLYSNSVSKADQGKIMGICFVVVALIWSFTALLGGVMMSANALLPLIIAPVGILLSILILQSSVANNFFN